MSDKDKRVFSLGVYAYLKYGPENITLHQLAQAEAAGYFLPNHVCMQPFGKVLCFQAATARKKQCKAASEQQDNKQEL